MKPFCGGVKVYLHRESGGVTCVHIPCTKRAPGAAGCPSGPKRRDGERSVRSPQTLVRSCAPSPRAGLDALAPEVIVAGFIDLDRDDISDMQAFGIFINEEVAVDFGGV